MSSDSESPDSSEDETYIPAACDENCSSNDEEEPIDGIDSTENDSEMSAKEVDKLWSGFKADVAARHTGNKKFEYSGAMKKSKQSSDVASSGEKKLDPKSESNTTITVTKVYDFAGEDVKITKQVDKNSKEARNHMMNSYPNVVGDSYPHVKNKRPAGLKGVLGKMSKKPRLSTLEKSKLDWQNYKEEEGIQDELQSFNKGKDGYLEKQHFLERTDYRQFEKERDLRLGKISKR